MTAGELILAALLPALVSAAKFCPTLHADFLRRQSSTFGSAVPYNEAMGVKHTPYVTINGTTATVTVGDGSPYHPMTNSSDPNVVHFVTHIYVLDQDGGFVAMDTLDPSDTFLAQMTFAVPNGTTKLKAYEFCNRHGLWEGPSVDVPEAGSSLAACAKDTVDVTAWPSFVADFARRQSVVFNSSEPYNETMGAKHVPYITLSGTTATVKVGDGNPYHPMTSSSDPSVVHFVTHIYVLDQTERVVALWNLNPDGADKAEVSFTVPAGAATLTAYEFCNKHGLWKGPAVTVPGGTAFDGSIAGAPRRAAPRAAAAALAVAGAATAALAAAL